MFTFLEHRYFYIFLKTQIFRVNSGNDKVISECRLKAGKASKNGNKGKKR